MAILLADIAQTSVAINPHFLFLLLCMFPAHLMTSSISVMLKFIDSQAISPWIYAAVYIHVQAVESLTGNSAEIFEILANIYWLTFLILILCTLM